jgi:hypothetical protein
MSAASHSRAPPWRRAQHVRGAAASPAAGFPCRSFTRFPEREMS